MSVRAILSVLACTAALALLPFCDSTAPPETPPSAEPRTIRRAGWPALHAAGGRRSLSAVRHGRTGLEDRVERLTRDPFERLVLLLLCRASNVDPSTVPLWVALYTPTDVADPPPFGIGRAHVRQLLADCEALLGRRLPETDTLPAPNVFGLADLARGGPKPGDEDYTTALAAREAGQHALTVRHLESASAAGHTEAMKDLGIVLVEGIGVTADPDRGFALLRRAADRGDDVALMSIGLLTLRGVGVSADPAAGIRWIRRAADRRNPLALHALGQAHLAGQGVTRDLARALRYLSLAARLGHVEAMTMVAMMMRDGAGTAADPAAAGGWFERAARRGDPRAARQLAYLCYDGGPAVPRDLARAAHWFEWQLRHDRPRSEHWPYALIRAWLSRSLDGDSQAASALLSAHREGVQGASWPGQLVAYLAGELDAAALLKAAGDDPGRLCEARFVIGSRALVRGDRSTARTELERCLATGKTDFVEHHSARAELARLGGSPDGRARR